MTQSSPVAHEEAEAIEIEETGGIEDRTLRYAGLIDPGILAEQKATIVGVGAVGRQLAYQLAAMGVNWIQLIDFDDVEGANLGPQAYFADDIGRPKVDATGELCHLLNPMLELHFEKSKWKRSFDHGNVVFMCVDDMDARGFIWQALKDKIGVDLIVDGRMAVETIRVLAAHDEVSKEIYEGSLFASEEAVQQSCTIKSTVYTANICAGLMVTQFSKWMRNAPVEADTIMNLLIMDLEVRDNKKQE